MVRINHHNQAMIVAADEQMVKGKSASGIGTTLLVLFAKPVSVFHDPVNDCFRT
jgi:hypothetical protein